MFPERGCGNAETRRDRETNPAQADKAQSLWLDCSFIDMLGCIKRGDSDLVHDENSLHMALGPYEKLLPVRIMAACVLARLLPARYYSIMW